MMKLAECRMKDPGCSYSRKETSIAMKGFAEGKNAAAVRADIKKEADTPPPVLEDPVKISTAGDPFKGPENAKVTIVEFSDFQCPFCSEAVKQANAVVKSFPNDVKLVFKQFPLEFHSQAAIAAEASLAAQAQGKFWEMHDRIFANPKSLIEPNFIAWAKELGMDVPRFTSDLRSHKYAARVQTEEREGLDAGVQGTPTVFINGRLHRGNVTLEELKPAIEFALKAHH
jgi:protein-disulfide isomerase